MLLALIAEQAPAQDSLSVSFPGDASVLPAGTESVPVQGSIVVAGASPAAPVQLTLIGTLDEESEPFSTLVISVTSSQPVSFQLPDPASVVAGAHSIAVTASNDTEDANAFSVLTVEQSQAAPRIWLLAGSPFRLLVLHSQTLEHEHEILLPVDLGRPIDLAVSSDRTRAFVSFPETQALVPIDVATESIESSIELPGRPSLLQVVSGASAMAIALADRPVGTEEETGSLVVLDMATEGLIEVNPGTPLEIEVPGVPGGIGSGFGATEIFLSDFAGGRIWQVDLATASAVDLTVPPVTTTVVALSSVQSGTRVFLAGQPLRVGGIDLSGSPLALQGPLSAGPVVSVAWSADADRVVAIHDRPQNSVVCYEPATLAISTSLVLSGRPTFLTCSGERAYVIRVAESAMQVLRVSDLHAIATLEHDAFSGVLVLRTY